MKNGGLTVDGVSAKLREYKGNMAAVARAYGVTRQAVHKFVKARPSLAEVSQECRETMKDHAESSLHQAVLAGEAWAVCFFLKTQAKDRGYTERTDHQHAGDRDAPIRHEHEHRVSIDEFRRLPLGERLRVLRAEIAAPSRN